MKRINYKSFYTMLALMFGFTIFSASVMSGADIASSMQPWQGAIAIVLGNILLATYGGFIAYVSHKRTKNLDGTLKRAFGKKGAIFPSMIMVMTQVGWFGVGIAMIAIPLADFANVSPWIFVFIVGLVVISTAFFGIKSLTWLSIIAVPLVILLGIVTMSLAVDGGSLVKLKAHAGAPTNILMGVAVVIGTFISGATFVPNFAVNADTTKNAVITTALAFFVGNGLMIVFGFVSQLFIGDRIFGFVEITKAVSTGLTSHLANFVVGIGMVILILNIWTTNDSGLYSISLGISHWIKIPKWSKQDTTEFEREENKKPKLVWISVPKRIWVVIFGLIGSALSLWLRENFIDFLSYMNRFVPPVGAIIIINYFFRKKESREYLWGTFWESVFIAILATGLVFIPAFTPYAPFISFGVAALVYMIYIFIEERYFNKNPFIKEDLDNEAVI